MPTLSNFKHSGNIAASIVPSVSVYVNVLLQVNVNHTTLACQDVVSVTLATTLDTVLIMV